MQMFLQMDTCGLRIHILHRCLRPVHQPRMVASAARSLIPKHPGDLVLRAQLEPSFPRITTRQVRCGSTWKETALTFLSFGFGVEFDAGGFPDPSFKQGGVRYLVNYPMPGPLYNRTSREFPTFNMAIPDQYRADVFMRELDERYIHAGKNLPPLLTLQLLNDHGAGERPTWISLTMRVIWPIMTWRWVVWLNTWVTCCNGRIWWLWWPKMMHRVAETILMHTEVYSWWYLRMPKKNFNSHRHTSFGSIFPDVLRGVGITSVESIWFWSSNLGDCFTDQPDFTPMMHCRWTYGFWPSKGADAAAWKIWLGGCKIHQRWTTPTTWRKHCAMTVERK